MIELNAISKRYNRRMILNDVNVTLEPGKIVGVLGPNAEGKSTLIKILAGHINEYDGSYIFNGEKFCSQHKNLIGYVSDKFFLPKGWIVSEAVDYYYRNFLNFNEEKAVFMLNSFNIDLNRKIKTLSKGECEKLHLILALSIKGDLYLLDEPLASVDILGREEILKTIVENFDKDSIMVIVSHLVRDVEGILDRALFLKNGQFLKDVDVNQVREEGKSLVDVYKEMFNLSYRKK